MNPPKTLDSPRRFYSNEQWAALWPRIHAGFLQHGIPDSRFHYDFHKFTPDFRGSSHAIDRITGAFPSLDTGHERARQLSL
jgi:hypothetical protein